MSSASNQTLNRFDDPQAPDSRDLADFLTLESIVDENLIITIETDDRQFSRSISLTESKATDAFSLEMNVNLWKFFRVCVFLKQVEAIVGWDAVHAVFVC